MSSLYPFHLQHSNGPAPAYAIESDSEDDEWVDDPSISRPLRPVPALTPSPSLQWTGPTELHFPPRSSLVVLVGDAGKLVASGLASQLAEETLSSLAGHLRLSAPHRLVLAPAGLSLHLQTPLARELIASVRPPHLTVVASYAAPLYVPTSEHLPIRYLCYSPEGSSQTLVDEKLVESYACEHFAVPNLVRGLEAALMTQASLQGIPATLLLLPATSATHAPAPAIPVGQYDFSVSAPTGLPSSLLVDSPVLQQTLKSLLDSLGVSGWRFPLRTEPVVDRLFASKTHATSGSSGLKETVTEAGLMYL